MCGICGIHRFGQNPIPRQAVDVLVLENRTRGLEAAGVALQQADGSVVVCKNDVTPFEFVTSKEYKDFMDLHLKADTITVLGHTRKATKGTPRVHANNHPMYSGTTAVVHNGVIHNDDQKFKDWKLDRKAETDSDIFRAILDAEGFTPKAINRMSQLNGSAAIAAVSTKYPGKLLLARSGNPIELMVTNQLLYFSSERGPLMKALRPYESIYGITMRKMTPKDDYFMIGMTNDSAWLIAEKPQGEAGKGYAKDWLEWHQELRIAINFNPVNYTCHAQYHGGRIKFYEDKPVDVVECPGCERYVLVPAAMLKDLKVLKCKNCGSKLA